MEPQAAPHSSRLASLALQGIVRGMGTDCRLKTSVRLQGAPTSEAMPKELVEGVPDERRSFSMPPSATASFVTRGKFAMFHFLAVKLASKIGSCINLGWWRARSSCFSASPRRPPPECDGRRCKGRDFFIEVVR